MVNMIMIISYIQEIVDKLLHTLKNYRKDEFEKLFQKEKSYRKRIEKL